MANLISTAENSHWVLTFEHLLNQIWYHVGHGELYVAAAYLSVTRSASLPYSHTVKRPHYGIWQAILCLGALGIVFTGQLLKPVRRAWWRAAQLGAFRRRELVRIFEDHTRGYQRDFLQPSVLVAVDGDVK